MSAHDERSGAVRTCHLVSCPHKGTDVPHTHRIGCPDDFTAYQQPDPALVNERARLALIKRLCVLQSRVAEQALGYDVAKDCFCRQPWSGIQKPMSLWSNDGSAVAFIEAAVTEKLQRHQATAAEAALLVRLNVARLAAGVGVTADDLAKASS